MTAYDYNMGKSMIGGGMGEEMLNIDGQQDTGGGQLGRNFKNNLIE